MQGIADRIQIQFGEYVRAGDEFETLVPPYAVVQQQLAAPRRKLAVHGLAISNDLRNIVLQTAPMTANSHYAISIPMANSVSDEQLDTNQDSHDQHAIIDVDLELTGVMATLTGKAAIVGSADEAAEQAVWTGWLPHVDWRVSQELTRYSAVHEIASIGVARRRHAYARVQA